MTIESVQAPGVQRSQWLPVTSHSIDVLHKLAMQEPIWNLLASDAACSEIVEFCAEPVDYAIGKTNESIDGQGSKSADDASSVEFVPMSVDDFHGLYEIILLEELRTMRQWHEIYPDAAAVIRSENALKALRSHRRSLSKEEKRAQAYIGRSRDWMQPWTTTSKLSRGTFPLRRPNAWRPEATSPSEAREIIDFLDRQVENDRFVHSGTPDDFWPA